MGEEPNRGLNAFSKKCAQIGLSTLQAWKLGTISLFSHCQSAVAKPVVTWKSAHRSKRRSLIETPPQMHCELERDFFLLFQHCHPDVQTLFLWITLLVEHTLKTCIKQGANKSNYGRLVGRRERGSRSGVVSLHICLHVQKSGQEKPQRFMGLIILHSTQGMFNCGSFLFSAALLHTAMSFLTKKKYHSWFSICIFYQRHWDLKTKNLIWIKKGLWDIITQQVKLFGVKY